MRTNLTQAKISEADFDKALDRLVASGKIEEIGNFRKDDWKIYSDEKVESTMLESPGWANLRSSSNSHPKNPKWEHQIRLVGTRHKGQVEYVLHRYSLPPEGMEVSLNDFDLEAHQSFTPPAGTWQMVDETTFGESRIISLFRHTSPAVPMDGDFPRSYVMEGFYILAAASNVDALVGMDPDKLRERLDDPKTPGDRKNYFQIRIGSRDGYQNTLYRNRKGPFDEDPSLYIARKWVSPDMTHIEFQLLPQTDTEVEIDGMFRLWKIPESDKWLDKHDARIKQKVTIGEWVVIPSATPAVGANKAAVIFRVNLVGAR